MPADPRKRQRKLERRAAKRKEKKHLINKGQSAGLAERLSAAARYPVLHCLATAELWTEGMGWVLLSRKLPDGSVAVVIFLVDRYCLGVKDVVADIVCGSTYETDFVKNLCSRFDHEDLPPPKARKIVERAVAYAQELGFPPDPDYHKAKHLFGNIDPGECPEEFEFGKDGKPLFYAGPYDKPARCREVISILTHTCGTGGFHYLIPMDGSEEVFADEDFDQEPASFRSGERNRVVPEMPYFTEDEEV
jgi:hypothetical protein